MSSPDAQALTQKVSGTLAEVASQKDAVAQKVTGTLSQAASQRDAVVNSVVQGVQDQGEKVLLHSPPFLLILLAGH